MLPITQSPAKPSQPRKWYPVDFYVLENDDPAPCYGAGADTSDDDDSSNEGENTGGESAMEISEVPSRSAVTPGGAGTSAIRRKLGMVASTNHAADVYHGTHGSTGGNGF